MPKKAPKERKVVRRAKGKPWPKYLVKAAIKLLRETEGNVTEAKRLLSETYQFEGNPPARSSFLRWAAAAGIDTDVRDPKRARDTSKATEARLARLDVARQELSEMLLGRLTRPAAEQIAARLEEAREAEELVTAARQAYQDALKAVPMVRDLMADKDPAELRAALKEAWKAVYQARNEVGFAMDFRIAVRDLVGVITRGLGDHLALEGLAYGDDQDIAGDIIVEHSIPRPDRAKADAEAVPERKLKVIDGGGSK